MNVKTIKGKIMKMNITSNAFIFYEDKLLLVFHKKLKRWMHVGGHVEEGESFDETLYREIKEEVGLEVDILDRSAKVPQDVTPDVINQKLPFYIHSRNKGKENFYNCLDYVCVAKSDKVKLKADELSDFRWVTRKELNSAEVSPYFKELALMAFNYYEEFGS